MGVIVQLETPEAVAQPRVDRRRCRASMRSSSARPTCRAAWATWDSRCHPAVMGADGRCGAALPGRLACRSGTGRRHARGGGAVPRGRLHLRRDRSPTSAC
jgi:hypothetical protein